MGDAELITVVPFSPAESLVLTRGCQGFAGFVWILLFVFKVQWLGLLVCRVFISLMLPMYLVFVLINKKVWMLSSCEKNFSQC